MEGLNIILAALLKIVESRLYGFPAEDLMNVHCWLATIPAPALNEYGIAIEGEERTAGIAYLAASMAFASAAALAVLGSITGQVISLSLPPFNLIWAAFAVLQVGRAVGIFWRYMNNSGMGPLRSSAYPAAYGDGGDSAPDDADDS